MRVKLNHYLTIFSLLFMAISLTTATSYGFVIGQNLIINTDFENDQVGLPPMEWALEKGG